MAYSRIYRGEFTPVLPGPGNIPSGATMPVFNEGLEWAPLATNATVDFNATDQHQSGNISAHVTGATIGAAIKFTSIGPISVKATNTIKFYIRLVSAFAGVTELRLNLYKDGSPIGSPVQLTDYGFNESVIGTWQQIEIPAVDINATENLYDEIRFLITTSILLPVDFYLDNITISGRTQVVRIDISDTGGTGGSGTGAVTGDIVVAGSGSQEMRLAPTAIPGSTFAERQAAWNEFFGFFSIGMNVTISGSDGSDGTYIITNIYSVFPPTLLGGTPGSFVIVLNLPVGSGDLSTHDVSFENITTSEVIPLEMAGDPLHISVIDNNEDKFTPIRPKQATINILTSEDIDISDFCEADDETFLVEIYVDDNIIFKGFLIIPDMQQDFLPHPNVLTLTAVDNLGTLKDQPLVDELDETPQNDNRIMDYISWSLRKTGLSLPINVINSVRHGVGAVVMTISFVYLGDDAVLTAINSDAAKFYVGGEFTVSGSASNNGTFRVLSIGDAGGISKAITTDAAFTSEGPVEITLTDESSALPFYDQIFIDAKTFEKTIGVCEDCSSVLVKIFKEDVVCFQQNGEWWAVRIDDIQGEGDYSVDRYDAAGVYVETTTISRFKNIGKPDAMSFMNDDCLIVPDRAYKKISETYRFNYPLETFCNIDFSRGDFIEDMPDEVIDGKQYNVKKYSIECWDYKKAPLNPDSGGAPDEVPYIKVYYQNGYEKIRFIVLPFDTDTHALFSQPIVLNKEDKFAFSVDFAWSVNKNAGPVTKAIYVVWLKGSNGDNYTLDSDGTWHLSDASWSSNVRFVELQWNSNDIDETKYRSVPVDSLPAPVPGKIYFSLVNSGSIAGTDDDVDTYFDNIQFTYIPFVNGSYQKYSGQQHIVSQILNNRAVREEEVYISDSPSPLFKGAMKIFNGNDYSLSYLFTDANHETPVPFGELQAWAVWNQYRSSNRNFDGTVDLMESESVDGDQYDGVDLLHKVRLTDSNPNTSDRLFMILHYDMDFYLLEWNTVIASLYRTDIGKVYTDDHVFNFLTSE